MSEYTVRKMGWKSLWLLLLMTAVVLLLALPGIADARSSTKTFEYGADVTLYERYSSRNYGSGSTCYVSGSRSSSRERSTLLYWNVNSLPKNSTITKVTIYLQVQNGSADSFYVYGLKRTWEESEATWVWATNRTRWAGGGASGSSDRSSYRAGLLRARYPGTATIELDPDLVQYWLDYPARNYGVIIANRSAIGGIGFYCSEATQRTQRPRLVVEYRY